MIHFRPYRPEDLKLLALRAEQKGARRLFELPTYAEQLAHPHLAQSALNENGVLIGVAGVLPVGPGRGYAWALVGSASEPAAWLSITREARRVLAIAHAQGLRRLEAHVLGTFTQGHRWARALGFVPNAVDEIFDGQRDHVGYVRIFPPRAVPPAVSRAALAFLADRYAALAKGMGDPRAAPDRWPFAEHRSLAEISQEHDDDRA